MSTKERIPTSANKYLDEDTLTGVFSYFNSTDLLSGGTCCTLWRNTCLKSEKQFWEPLTVKLWDDMITNRPDFNEIDILSRVKRISLLQIKRALQRVDINRCVEKIDFQRMLIAKLLFKNKSAENSTALRIYYPEWALKIGVYKATYFHNAADLRRNTILMGELTAIEWRWTFRNDQSGQPPTTSWFKDNFTLTSTIGPNATFNWNVSFPYLG
jgi:hypothetical protein